MPWGNRPRQTLKERFWEKVDMAGDCWIWTGCTTAPGKYGRIVVDGKLELAHRVSWEMANGPIPEIEGSDFHGTCVCHSCDVKSCVNPAHLFLGTHQDNMDDMATKGRNAQPKGSKQHLAKMTESEVRSIRAALARGQTQQSLADIYGVVQTSISKIACGLTWGHVV